MVWRLRPKHKPSIWQARCRTIWTRAQFKDTRSEYLWETDRRFILSREKRICYATVGLILQEGRRQNCDVELFCRNLKREAEEARERYTSSGTSGPGERANGGGERTEGQVENRTESRRLEVGGSGAEISFYGRVTNLRTRHCRVPADGRTMRLRNTMLHSGNLKAVLTTNLQPPILASLCVPLPHHPILAPSTHTHSTSIAHRTILPPPSTSVVTFSFFCSYSASCLSAKISFQRSFLGRSSWVTISKFIFINLWI